MHFRGILRNRIGNFLYLADDVISLINDERFTELETNRHIQIERCTVMKLNKIRIDEFC